jgi:hypothetical protein
MSARVHHRQARAGALGPGVLVLSGDLAGDARARSQPLIVRANGEPREPVRCGELGRTRRAGRRGRVEACVALFELLGWNEQQGVSPVTRDLALYSGLLLDAPVCRLRVAFGVLERTRGAGCRLARQQRVRRLRRDFARLRSCYGAPLTVGGCGELARATGEPGGGRE